MGKSHLLGVAAQQARQRGVRVLGPIDGRELVGCPSCWEHGSNDASEPLGGLTLPPHDADEPLLVLLDDAHLADPDRLRLEMRWLSRSVRVPHVWVCTVRSPGRPAVVPADDVEHAVLGELAEPEVTEIVTELLDAPPHATLSELVAEAGGNARLVTDLVTGLREEGALTRIGGRMQVLHDDVPQRVRRTVHQRLNTLSPQCRQILRVGAALDRRLCPSVMAEVLAKPVAGTLPLLEEAREAGLVTSDGPVLKFRSMLLWRAIRASAPEYVHAALRDEAPCAAAGATDALWSILGDKGYTIALLAAEGLTNQQIARRVHLSPHTVNYHLRGIFRKLDVASRTELAKLIADADPDPRGLRRGA